MKKIVNAIAFVMLWVAVLPAYSQISQPQKQVKLFFEKIFVHTDRQIYTSGDDLWFKAYLVNAQDNRLINTSKNLYAELITPGGKLLSREIIPLNNGLGKGDFKLPDSVAAGTYHLRAYTNWMRNFGNNFIFEKSITVINAKASAAIISPKQGPVIGFFPEGGSLLQGISSVVAVKATAPTGKGVAARGAVLSSSGDTVARFTTDTLGMGLFTLLPLPGQSYTAIIYGNKNQQIKLPAALTTGLALKLYRKDTTIYAVVSCNEASLAGYATQTLTIKGRTYGKVTFQQNLQLKGGTAALAIPTTQLPGGITSITLYDGDQKPNCERLIFTDNTPKNNLVLNLDKTTYLPREKATVDVQITDGQGRPVNGYFSAAAVDAAVVPPDDSNIKAYLMLQSELKGPIEHAAQYFDTVNTQRFKQLDLLLLTQGWRDFIWKRLADTTLRIAYIPEQGISLSGMVNDKKGQPLPGANITLIAPKASNGRLFSAQTDTRGKYYFDNLLLYGPQNVRLNSKDAKGKSLGIISLDSLADNYPPIDNYFLGAGVASASLTAINKAALIKQVRQAKQRSLSDTLIRLNEVKVSQQQQQVLRDQTVTSLGYKDEVLTVTPDDLRYNTLRDYIQFASKQARVDAETNRLYFLADGRKIPPRIILNNRDALFTDNDPDDVIDLISNSYFDLPVSAIEKVVIKKLVGSQSLMVSNPDGSAATAAALRPSGATTSQNTLGVVFAIYLTLKPGALNKPEPGATQAELNGYYEARTFYSPVYDKPKADTRIDARPTLYWQPDGRTAPNGHSTLSYYNSDSKTTVRLIVQGITTAGIPVVTVKTYVVK